MTLCLKTISSKPLLASLVAGASLSACGVSGSSDDAPRQIEQLDTELTGSWVSPCESLDFAGLTRRQETFSFKALSQFERVTTLYADDTCAQAAASLTVRGSYQELSDATSVANAKNINFTVREALLNPSSATLADALDGLDYCAVEDWSAGQAVSILNRDCLGERYSDGQVIQDIYRRGENELRFGEAFTWFDRQGNDARPEALNEVRVYTKK